MEETKSLVTTKSRGYQVETLEDMKEVADIFVKSGLFADARDIPKAIVKIMAGKELGLDAFASMRSVDIIQGQCQVKPGCLAGLVKKSGKYNYRIKSATAEGCTIEFSEGGVVQGEVSFLKEDAERAGLINKDNYKKWASDMYFNRALARGVRRYCPDIIQGPIYIEGEIIPEEVPAELPKINIDNVVTASDLPVTEVKEEVPLTPDASKMPIVAVEEPEPIEVEILTAEESTTEPEPETTESAEIDVNTYKLDVPSAKSRNKTLSELGVGFCEWIYKNQASKISERDRLMLKLFISLNKK
jgi:hypothetical protein